MKTYRGRREGQVTEVTVDNRPLDPRLDLWNHSPTGFEWGYGGSGPAQLALALLADHMTDEEQAVSLHQDFKRVVVARLPYRGWELTGSQMNAWLEIVKSRSTAALPQGG
jgi:hypothetical protein